jgi:hypothetical protein
MQRIRAKRGIRITRAARRRVGRRRMGLVGIIRALGSTTATATATADPFATLRDEKQKLKRRSPEGYVPSIA